jgi:hypothetical protein
MQPDKIASIRAILDGLWQKGKERGLAESGAPTFMFSPREDEIVQDVLDKIIEVVDREGLRTV